MSDSIIQIKEVNKWYGDFQVLKDINLEVKAKEKIVVCGPSGSGKSTLIRCINRLEEHQKGNIIVDGTEISEDTKNIEQVRAEVGMVFQQFNLFPHLSIVDNCTLAPIWVKKMAKERCRGISTQTLRKSSNFRSSSKVSRSTFRWTTTKGSNSKSFMHGT
jgi:general L-amino acid transport system ATP-binding protein